MRLHNRFAQNAFQLCFGLAFLNCGDAFAAGEAALTSAYICTPRVGQRIFVEEKDLPSVREASCIPIEYKSPSIPPVHRCITAAKLVQYTDAVPLVIGAEPCKSAKAN